MLRLSKKFLFIAVALILLVTAGYFTWQHYKYRIARNSLKSTVKAQTDSLYSIKYDSLSFDAVSGHATMENIRIIPDTDRVKNMDVENMPDLLVNITIRSLVVTGVQTVKALHGNKIEGDSVILNDPQIILYSLKPLQKKTIFQNEAQELYKQILGKLDLIKVGFVFVNNVHVKGIDFFNKDNNFELINGKFVLEDVLIDSSHHRDPDRILFCKQAAFSVDSFFSYNHNREELAVRQVHFLGRQQKLLFQEIKVHRFENDTSASVELLDATGLTLTGVNTNEIVKNKNMVIDTIRCKGIDVYQVPLESLKTTSHRSAQASDSTGFTNVYSIHLGHLVFPRVKLLSRPDSHYSIGNISIRINEVKADKIVQVEERPMNYTREAQVDVDRFSLASADKTYRFDFNGVSFNSLSKSLHLGSLRVVPFAADRPFAAAFKFQKDRYALALDGLYLKDIDMNSLLDKRIEAAELQIEHVRAEIYRDLHKPLQHQSKIGNYPSQLLMKIGQPVRIGTVKINNAFIEYRENESVSDSTGVVKFTDSRFELSNVTNIPDAIRQNNRMNMTFSTRALAEIPLQGKFSFVLGGNKGDFSVDGHGGAFDAKSMDKVSVPMALVKIKSGKIHSIDFHLKGNNSGAGGDFLMNYDHMKIEILKRDKDTRKLKKRGLLSLAANVVVSNRNSGTSVTAHYDRNEYKSFFNLVWKTIFDGMKKTLGVPASIGN